MMKSSAALFGLGIVVLSALMILPSPVWAKDPINKNWRGLAINGYDPVAYFKLGKPVKGKYVSFTACRRQTLQNSESDSLKNIVI